MCVWCVLGIIDQTLSTVTANLVPKAYVTKCDGAHAQRLKNSPWRKKRRKIASKAIAIMLISPSG